MLPTDSFRPHEVGGYWITDEPVDAIDQLVTGDLLARHARANIELRITPSLAPFWHQVTNSTVVFSGSRLRDSVSPPGPSTD